MQMSKNAKQTSQWMRDKDREDSLHIQLVSGMEQTVESMREAGEIKKDRKRERKSHQIVAFRGDQRNRVRNTE